MNAMGRSDISRSEAREVFSGAKLTIGELAKVMGRHRRSVARVHGCYWAFESLIAVSIATTGRPPGDVLTTEQFQTVKDRVENDLKEMQAQRYWGWYLEWLSEKERGPGEPVSEPAARISALELELALRAMWVPPYWAFREEPNWRAEGPNVGRFDGRELKWRVARGKVVSLWHDDVEMERLRAAIAGTPQPAKPSHDLVEGYDRLQRCCARCFEKLASQLESEAIGNASISIGQVEDIILGGGNYPGNREFQRLAALLRAPDRLNRKIAQLAEDCRRVLYR